MSKFHFVVAGILGSLSIILAPFAEASELNIKTIQVPLDLAKQFYPERALALRKSGDVMVECTLSVQEQPQNCSIVFENPIQFGFGAYSLKLVSKYDRASLASMGRPGDRLRFAVAFRP